MLPNAYGTFKKRGDHIFRTEARLQWGNSNDSLGLIIMLNPGSSKLGEPTQWQKFLDKDGDYEAIDQELEMDDTMLAIAYILELSHPNLLGYLEIRNLFNLRTEQAKAKVAIDEYNGLMSQPLYEDVLYNTFTDLDHFPWVWLAWTVDPSPVIKKRKVHILKRLNQAKWIFALCKEPPHDMEFKEYYCYHPYPQIPKQVKWYRDGMVQQMQDYWKRMRG